MTVNNIQELKQALEDGKMIKRWFCKTNITPDAAGTPMLATGYSGMPPQITTPSTAVAPTRTTTGAVHFPTPQGSNNSFLMGMGFNLSATQGILLMDILSWQGGLSGTVTGAQTTNLPTAALTRYTTGEGVMLGLACWVATGSTSVNVTASYTNQAGTTGRTTVSVAFWGGGFGAVTGAPTATQVQFLPLQSGDYGVRAVASVTLSASTLTSGNFGVFLCKPLAMISNLPTNSTNEIEYVVSSTMMPEILDNAFLTPICGMNSTTAFTYWGYLNILQV